MEEFSKQLSLYIRRCGYTNMQFAKLCGVERTLMQKYLVGKRIPRDTLQLAKMISVLCLTPDEEEDFRQAYEKVRIGGAVYEQRRAIRHMIESFGDLVTAGERTLPNWFGSETKQSEITNRNTVAVAENRSELLQALWDILHYEKQREHCEICISAQLNENYLNGMILNLTQAKNVKIRHLICLDGQKEGEAGLNNLHLLEQVLPFLGGKAEYDIKFYYGSKQLRNSRMLLLPNLVLTEHFTMIFDNSFQRGVIQIDPAVHRLYQNLFGEMEEKADYFLERHKNILETVMHYKGSGACDYTLQYQPCLAYALSGEVLEKVIDTSYLGGDEGILNQFVTMMESWGTSAIAEGRAANTNYFTENGIRDFMETGRVREFPDEYYSPLPLQDRYTILETCCQQMKNGFLDGRILDQRMLRIDSKLVIQMSGTEAVHFILCREDGSQVILCLKESGIVNAFRDFMESFSENTGVKSREETITVMEKMLEKYAYASRHS